MRGRAVASLVVVVSVACGDFLQPEFPTLVGLEPTSAAIVLGDTIRFTATVLDAVLRALKQ